jgi:hypothetical protein
MPRLSPHGPVFYNSPIRDAYYTDEAHVHTQATRGDTHELTLVGAVKRLARGDLVCFGDHVLYSKVGVGEGPPEHGRDAFDPLTVRAQTRRGTVVDELGREISSIRSVLPRLWTSSTKRRTRALFSPADTASSPSPWISDHVGIMMPLADT